MIPDIEFYLKEYGVTNLIDVDGLLYAPVGDLWRFYHEVTVDHLVQIALAMVAVVAIGWCIRVIADFIVGLIESRKKTVNT